MHNKLCPAPFVSFYTGQYNKVSSCCAMKEAIGYSDKNKFEDIMNSNVAKGIRKSFLANKFPSECHACSKYEKETGHIAGMRQFNIDLTNNNFDFLRDVLPDGTLTRQEPVFLDLLFSNKCNFACMGCSGELSNTIADKYSQAYDIVDTSGNQNRNWHNKSNVIDYILAHKDTIKKLHLNGGEPFMQEDVHELLDVMLKHGLHHKIEIWSHTNGSIKKYKGVDVVEDYLKYWKKCSISLSSDGYGAQGEYVRYGSVAKRWEDTFYRLIDADILVDIQTCYNIFNSVNLLELYNYYTEHLTAHWTGCLNINPWFDPQPFTAQAAQLSPEVLERANKQLDLVEEKINALSDKKGILWDIPALRSTLNIKWNKEHCVEMKSKFQRGIKMFDNLRKTNFIQTFPELSTIYLN